MFAFFILLYCAALSLAWLIGLRLVEYNAYLVGSAYGASILLGGLIERCIAKPMDGSLPAMMGRAFLIGLIYFLPIIAARAGAFWISTLVFSLLIVRVILLLTQYRRGVM